MRLEKGSASIESQPVQELQCEEGKPIYDLTKFKASCKSVGATLSLL